MDGLEAEQAITALVATLVAEDKPEVRAAIGTALGVFANKLRVQRVLSKLVEDGRAIERVAACDALAANLPSEGEVDPKIVRMLRSVLASNDQDVLIACVAVLRRLPDLPGALVTRRDELSRPPTAPPLRVAVSRTYAKHPPSEIASLIPLLSDPEVVVRVHIWRALRSALSNPEHQAVLVERFVSRETEHPMEIETAAALLMSASLTEAAQARLRKALVELSVGTSRGLLRCRLAQLVDKLDGRIEATPRCSTKVSARRRQELVTQLLAHADATHPSFTQTKQSALSSEQSWQRVLAVSALGGRDDWWSQLEPLRDDENIGVRVALLEVLKAHPDVAADPTPFIKDTLVKAIDDNHLEGILTALGFFGAPLDQEIARVVGRLRTHPNYSVRQKLEELGVEVKRVSLSTSPEHLALRDESFSIASLPTRAVLRLSGGEEVTLRLLPEDAPLTVSHFAQLAEDGAFTGTVFHRVVPAFVAQGGDPEGHGYGGPAFSQRCEDNSVRYERGTVGMALAGRDTGGSQFFVTYSREVHLDRKYTAFARVIEGMEHIEQLVQGTSVESVTTSR